MSSRDSHKNRTTSANSISSLFTTLSISHSNSNSQLNSAGPTMAHNRASLPASSAKKSFHSLYERTVDLISKLYAFPDFEDYLFPYGIPKSSVDFEPIDVLWRCFRLGAPLCHLLNQANPQKLLAVPDVSAITDYSKRPKECVFYFLGGVSEELGIPREALFTISELGNDNTNGLVKVMDVVELVLDEIQRRGLTPPAKDFPIGMGIGSGSCPKDNRSRTIAELLQTERGYVQSLQELLEYKEELASRGTISNDLLHTIFSNLAELLDFQRRFLFSLEAAMATTDEQNIGAVFLAHEEGFQVYTPMCASYSKAIAVALENQDLLSGSTINPGRDLQGYLIKPIQRICRYPMLLKEIVKLSSPEKCRYFDELKEAEEVMKRVTDIVNEVQRMEENRQLKEELIQKIDDFQGSSPTEWGDLLLYDKFPMLSKEVDQLYHIYLFEVLLICCKESSRESKRRQSSKNILVEVNHFDIKGKIYATSISDVLNTSSVKDGRFEVKVFWNDMEESFVLKCRNAEQADLWSGRITACASGNTKKYQQMRPSSDKSGLAQNTSAFSRVKSYNANMHDQPFNPSAVVDMPTTGAHRRQNSRDLPNSREIPKRSSSNMFNHSAGMSRSPSMPLKAPPSSALPLTPNYQARERSATTSQAPPSMPLPPPPVLNSRSGAGAPPKLSLPVPPSTSTAPPSSGPPRSALPPPPTSISDRPPNVPLPGPPKATLPGPPNVPLPGPPRATLPGPPNVPLPGPPKATLPGPPNVPLPGPPNVGPPNAALPAAPAAADSIIPSIAETRLGPTPTSVLPMPPTVPNEDGSRASSRLTSTGLVKMKTHYGADIFILGVPATGPKFDEILDRIERKIRISGAAMPEGRRVKLKYRDEDGDFINLNGDDDIEMAFQMASQSSQNGTVTIQVE